jgi:hypothetical protein
LKPRVDKEWEKLGKKAPKRKIELVSEEEIKKSIDEAKKQREKIEKKEARKTKSAEEEEKPKESLEEKQVAPLTFNNGVMIGTIKELKDYLVTMDKRIFAEHVNDSKNDILQWITENFGEEEGKKFNVKTKEEMKAALENFGKKKEVQKKKVSKENNKKKVVKNEKKLEEKK